MSAKSTAANKTAEPEAKKQDLSVILPDGAPGHVTVLGRDCTVRRLKSREILFVMKIVTTGMGDNVMKAGIDMSSDDAMKADVTAILLASIPNAIPETMTFVMNIVDPVDPEDGDVVHKEMQNPDPNLLIDVVGVMVEQEAEDFASLVGKCQAWLARLQKVLPNQTGRKGRGRGPST